MHTRLVTRLLRARLRQCPAVALLGLASVVVAMQGIAPYSGPHYGAKNFL